MTQSSKDSHDILNSQRLGLRETKKMGMFGFASQAKTPIEATG